MEKEYAYINKFSGHRVIVVERKLGFYYSIDDKHFQTGSLKDAETDLFKQGYSPMWLKDEQGVTRHAMPRGKVESLYNQLQNFIADCTVDEYKANEQAFTAIKTLLHKRMQ